jgi:hypothetical protein
MGVQWIFQYDPFIRSLRRTLRGMHSLPDSDTRHNIKNIWILLVLILKKIFW